MPPRTAGPIGRQVDHPGPVAAKLRRMRPGSGRSRRNPPTPTLAPNRPPAPEIRAACREFAPGTRRVATAAARVRAYRSVTRPSHRPWSAHRSCPGTRRVTTAAAQARADRSVTAPRLTVCPAAHRPSSAGPVHASPAAAVSDALAPAGGTASATSHSAHDRSRSVSDRSRPSSGHIPVVDETGTGWMGSDESRAWVRGCRSGALGAVTSRRLAVDANSHVVQGMGRIGECPDAGAGEAARAWRFRWQRSGQRGRGAGARSESACGPP